MTTLFISDLHLTPDRPDITEAFKRFMDNQAKRADALYILGDFFEVWIGDDDDAPYGRQIIALLKEYSDSGKALYFMSGNRDFLISDVFAKDCGATLLSDPCVIDLYGTPVLLMHGDTLCTKDLEYMAFREQARSAPWQQALLSKPLEERRAIAKQLREQSASMSSMKAEDIMDVTPDEVVKQMEQHQVQLLLHGHTHRPETHQLTLTNHSDAVRMVLGDWGKSIWWAEATLKSPLTLVSEPA